MQMHLYFLMGTLEFEFTVDITNIRLQFCKFELQI